MNKNYFSDGIMRRMRQYTLALSNNAHSKDKDLENLLSLKKADEITQTVYDREVERRSCAVQSRRNRFPSIGEEKGSVLFRGRNGREDHEMTC